MTIKRLTSLLGVGFCAACSSSSPTDGSTNTPPPPPAPAMTMVAVAGQNQTTDWADGVPVLPAVMIVDTVGHPVAGISVIFTAGGGNGSVTGATATTGADGIATVGGWLMGLPTGPKALTATATGVGGSPILFHATAVGMAEIQKYTGSDQSEPHGTVVLDVPSIQATTIDGSGTQILVGATVTFTVTSGGGSITGGTTTTDNYGYARVGSWTLGAAPGTNTLSATVAWPGARPITFTATGTP